MENVLIAVAIVCVFAFAAWRGCEWVDRITGEAFERRFPSRARAWEELGRRDEKDAA